MERQGDRVITPLMYGRCNKKVPIYRPYNGTGNSVTFPFNIRAVAVLVRFQTVPVHSGERPGLRN